MNCNLKDLVLQLSRRHDRHAYIRQPHQGDCSRHQLQITNLEPLSNLEADDALQACTGEFDLESVKKLTMCGMLCSSARMCYDDNDDGDADGDCSFTPSSQVQHEHSDNRAARRLQQLHRACNHPHIISFNRATTLL